MKNEKFVPLGEREGKQKKTRVYRESYEYLKEQEERTRIARQIYEGKSAIRQSWMIANPRRLAPGKNFLERLERDIARHKSYLAHRGEEV